MFFIGSVAPRARRRIATIAAARSGITRFGGSASRSDADVWDYIESEKIPVNPLYECGFSRVGCVGCPMAGTQGRQKEFIRYPKYQDAYIRAFDKMLEERERRGKTKGTWTAGTTGRDVFHWWMEDGVLPGQMELDDLLLEEDEEW